MNNHLESHLNNNSQQNSSMFLQNISSGDHTMSSREVAQLCEKRHDHVGRAIDNLNATYVSMALPKVGEGYYTHPNTGSQRHREFLLTQEQCLDLITGYRADLRIRVNRRWQELEAQLSSPSIPQSLPEALRLAADLAEKLEQQKAQLAIAAPKAAALDVIGAAEGSLGVRETAKTIGIAQNKFVAWCVNNEWMYRDSKDKLQPYSGRIQQGYMEQRPVTFNGRDGTARATTQPMFTPKGLARLAQIFAIVHEVA